MREIKFRGKDIATGEWRYGSLLVHRTHAPHIVDCTGRFPDVKTYTVKSDTVGQFTGLKDKNGVEIYEGDVVIQHGHGMNDIQGYVTYEPSSAMFVLSYETYGCMHIETLQSKKVYNDYNTSFSVEHTFEVIGNIHDSPELINKE